MILVLLWHNCCRRGNGRSTCVCVESSPFTPVVEFLLPCKFCFATHRSPAESPLFHGLIIPYICTCFHMHYLTEFLQQSCQGSHSYTHSAQRKLSLGEFKWLARGQHSMAGVAEPTSDPGFPTLHYTISKQSLHIGYLWNNRILL